MTHTIRIDPPDDDQGFSGTHYRFGEIRDGFRKLMEEE